MTTTLERIILSSVTPIKEKQIPAALDGVDLKIESGQLYGLVGPDGARKTSDQDFINRYSTYIRNG